MKRNQKLYFAILSEKQGDTIGTDKRGNVAEAIVALAMRTGIRSIAINFAREIEHWDTTKVIACHLADDIYFIVSATESGRNIAVNQFKNKS